MGQRATTSGAFFRIFHENAPIARHVGQPLSLTTETNGKPRPRDYRFSYFISISCRGTPASVSKPPDRITSASLPASRK